MVKSFPVTIADGFEAAKTTAESASALREYGLTMFASQVLEERIGMLLRLRYERASPDARNTYDRLLKRGRETLGDLIRVLKGNVGEEFYRSAEARLSAALKARNFVAHRYFRLNWPEYQSVTGIERAAAKLREQRGAIEGGLLALREIESRLGREFSEEAKLLMGELCLSSEESDSAERGVGPWRT